MPVARIAHTPGLRNAMHLAAPAYHGSYFFADFASGFVARLDTANGNAAYAFAQVPGLPVDLIVGRDGALYVLMRGAIARIASQ